MEWWQQLNTGQSSGPKPGSIEALNLALQAQQSQNVKPKSQGIDPRAFISEIAGTAGAIGGGIIGGPVGAAAGAAGLTALGKALEQKVKGEEINTQNLLTESALAGIFGYGPLRAAGKLTGISATKTLAGAGAKPLAGLAAKESVKTGALGATKAGSAKALSDTQRNLLKNTFNTFAGAKAGSKRLSEAESNKLINFAINNNIITANTTGQTAYSKLSKLIAKSGADIGDLIKSAPAKTYTAAENKNLVSSLKSAFATVDGVDWKKNTFANRVTKSVQKAKTPEELWGILQRIRVSDTTAKGITQASSNIKQLAKQAEGVLSSSLKTNVPGYDKLANKYFTGNLLSQYLGPVATSPRAGGRMLKGIPIGGRAIERAVSTIGTAGTGQVARGGLTQSAYNLLNPAARQGIGLQGVSALGSRGTAQLASQGFGGAAKRMIGAGLIGNTMGTTAPTESMMGAPISPQPQAGMDEVSAAQSPYSLENLRNDIQRDPYNATKYINYYQELEKVYGVGGQQLQLSDTAIKNVNDVQKGLQDIVDLGTKIQSSEGLVDPILGRIRSANPYDVEAKNLQSSIDRVRQVIGKALEGGVLRKEDEEKYKKILPTIIDNKETAIYKIQQIYQALDRDLNNYVNLQSQYGKGAGTTNTLEDTLLRLQTGGK